MSTSPGEIRRWMQRLVARSVEEQVRGAQRYGELLRRVAQGNLDDQAVRQRYVEFLREETGRYVRNVVSLGLAYYDNLLEAGWDYSNRFFNRLLEEPSAEVPEGEPRRVAMDLRAPLGEDAVGSFVLQNKRTLPADISFVVSEFSGPADTSPFRPPLQIDPPRFTLAPLTERAVTIRVPVLSELFQPGLPYTATIAVRGQEELELVLSVQAEQGGLSEGPAGPVRKRASRSPASKGATTRGGKPKAPASRGEKSGTARRAKSTTRRKPSTRKGTGRE